MDSEYNANKVKEIFDVSENQQFDAVEYFKVPEVSNNAKENISVEEQLDSTNGNNRINQYEDNNSYDRLNQNNTNNQDVRAQNQAQDKYHINQGGSENVQATGAESSASTTTAASTTSAAAAGTSAGSAVVASSASLAGVTILAAAAVAAVGASPVIATPDPLVNEKTAKYEVGIDYIVYDLDIKGLTEGIDYFIDVKDSTGKFIEAYPISSNGHVRHIVSGLNPNTPYDLRLFAKDSAFHEIVYYTARCNTIFDSSPKAIFNILPNIDYDRGLYNLDCEIYISDFDKILQESYIEMYINDQEYMPEYDYANDFYKFNINNLTNESIISGIAYGLFPEDEDHQEPEERIIGSYEYEVKYPGDFVSNMDRSFAIYDFNENNISYEFDSTQGNLLSVYTGFNNIMDPRDYYKITAYDEDGEEINSSISFEPSVTLAIEPMYEDITLKLTLLKLLENEEFRELESEEMDYHIPNEFIRDVSMEYNDTSFTITGTKDQSLEGLEATFYMYYKDGMSSGPLALEVSALSDTEFSSFAELPEGDHNYTDIDYIEVVFSKGELRYARYRSKPVETTIDTYDVLDNGSIMLYYDISLPEGATFVRATARPKNCQLDEMAYEGLEQSGTLEVLNLYSDNLMIDLDVTYELNGVEYTVVSTISQKYELDVDLDWFGIYQNSGFFYVEKVYTKIDGKDVNSQLDVMVNMYNSLSGEYEEENHISASSLQIGNYYGIRTGDESAPKDKLDYRIILNEDGDEISGTMSINDTDSFISNLKDGYYFTYKLLGNNIYATSYVEPHYFKTYNSDGTINLHLYTGFENTSATNNIFGQFFIAGENSGGINTIMTEETTDPYVVISNLPDTYYDIKYNVGIKYKDTTWFLRESFDLKEVTDETVSFIEGSDKVTLYEGPMTQVDFQMLDVFKGDSISIEVGGNTYSIPLVRDSSDPRVIDMTDENEYAYVVETDDYSVQVNVEPNDYNNYRKFYFSLQVNDVEALDAKLSFTYAPTYLLDNMSGVNTSSIEKAVTMDIAKYKGVIDTENISVTYDDSTSYNINGLSFDYQNDDRDYYIITAEWDNLKEETDISSFSAEVTYYTLESVHDLEAGQLYYQMVSSYYVPYIPTANETVDDGYYLATEVKKYEAYDSGKTYYSHVVGKTGVLRSDGQTSISIDATAFGDENITLYAVQLKQTDWYEYKAYEKIEIQKLGS